MTFNFDEDLKFPSRISEMFFMFAMIIPVYNKHQRITVRSITGHDMAELIPQYLLDVAAACETEPEKFKTYAIWIRDALNYVLEETDTMPMMENFSTEKYNALKNQIICQRKKLLKQMKQEKQNAS